MCGFLFKGVIKLEYTKSLIMGLWKFNENIAREELEKVAHDWVGDENYIQLYVRQTSKTQQGIGFAYTSNGTKEEHDDYFAKTSDFLKRKFGNDLVGWDIATTSSLIKGF